MVVQEESRGDVERYENINGVVLVCSQDEENAKEIQNPGQGVNKVPAPRSVWEKKERKNLINYKLLVFAYVTIPKEKMRQYVS